MIKKLIARFFPLLLLFFANCFDYEEVIYFRKPFSGYVEITYTVPVHPRTGKSLLRFLPLSSEEIEKKINKGIFSKNLKIREHTLTYVEKTENDSVSFYQKKARVNYKLDFEDLNKLDGILLGYLFVKKKGSSLIVKREFKSVLKGLDQNSTTGEKQIHAETLKLLGDSSILFKVIFPNNWECRSSRGDIFLGSLIYRFPLSETVDKPGNKTWDYTMIYSN